MQENKSIQPDTPSLPCNLCGCSNMAILATRSRNNTQLRSVICQECGLVWSDPFPHDSRHFYEKDYRLEYKNTSIPKPNHVLQAGIVALERYNKIKHLLAGPKTILDVGTGGGEFAYLLKCLGHDLHGIEPNKGYAGYSVAEYGLTVQTGFIQDECFDHERFDVITIWHVLEHTEDPCLVLGKLRRLLKPEGVLVVEVPNIEAICQSPKSTFHEAHLFNFNSKTLSKMGEKAGLIAESHLFSFDAGNITLFFRQAEPGNGLADSWAIDHNAKRIIDVIQGHTNLKHYLTATPYQRFLRRMVRRVFEKNTVKAFANNKDLLDQLYQEALSQNS